MCIERLFQILSVWGLVAEPFSGEAVALAGGGNLFSGGLWSFCGNVYRLSRSGNRGDAGQYSHPGQTYFFPAWTGACYFEYGNREALWLPALFLGGTAQDSVRAQTLYTEERRDNVPRCEASALPESGSVRCRMRGKQCRT